jgi:hypothetical protein
VSQSLANPTTAEWFNTAAFTLQPLYTFGDAGRNTIIGPAGFCLDFSTHKDFRLPREGHDLRVRWEAFNALNHPDGGNPNATLTSPQFGQITRPMETSGRCNSHSSTSSERRQPVRKQHKIVSSISKTR